MGVILGCPAVYLGLEDAGEPIVCGPVAKGSSLPSQTSAFAPSRNGRNFCIADRCSVRTFPVLSCVIHAMLPCSTKVGAFPREEE